MDEEKLTAPELRHLIRSLSEHGNHHLAEAEKDLAQTTALLAEAVQKLMASFIAIHEMVCVQQETTDMLIAGHPVPPDVAATLKAAREKIASNMDEAVTSLQFQDMTNQLIGRVMHRIAGMRDALNAMDSNAEEGLAHADAGKMAEMLFAINETLESRSMNLQNMLRKQVSQSDMGSGDIELF